MNADERDRRCRERRDRRECIRKEIVLFRDCVWGRERDIVWVGEDRYWLGKCLMRS